MKVILASFIAVSLFIGALSLTCYRCGGAAENCDVAGSNTIECDDPGFNYGCRVYTVNYTTLNQVIDIKSCCLIEDCDSDPCAEFGNGAICSNMASCGVDKCNFNYTTGKASPKPTAPNKAPAFINHRDQLAMLAFFTITALAYMKL